MQADRLEPHGDELPRDGEPDGQVQELEQCRTGLPAPKWCFVVLGFPTFYMPLACLLFATWTMAGILPGGEIRETPSWMLPFLGSALCVTLATWPVYIAWIGFSKRLALREKGLWLVAVVLGNMVAMPVFYIFMVRRYLGLEGRTGQRARAALDRFLQRHGVDRDRLSADQVGVLESYCRKCRLARWCVVPMAMVAALMLYSSVVFSQRSVRLFSDFIPTRVVITDSAKGTKKEIAPEPETMRLHVQNVLMLGAMDGMMGAMGFFMLAQALAQTVGGWHRKALIEFLKATDREHAQGPPT